MDLNLNCFLQVMEMYADPNSRGGVLEPEGTVEIKFKEKDIRATMRRLDEKYNTLIAGQSGVTSGQVRGHVTSGQVSQGSRQVRSVKGHVTSGQVSQGSRQVRSVKGQVSHGSRQVRSVMGQVRSDQSRVMSGQVKQYPTTSRALLLGRNSPRPQKMTS